MFTGLTLSSLLTDAGSITDMFTVIIGIFAAFWAGRRLLNLAKGFLRR